MSKAIDLAGKRFGRLVVIAQVSNNRDGRAMWMCKCDCGNEKIVMGKCLRSGHTQSCGCMNKEINSKRSLVDRTGDRFGRLVVVSRADDYIAPNGSKHVMWKCKCDCGNETIVDVCQLTGGKTKSCGCLKEQSIRHANMKHGGRYDRLYKVYSNMKNRCYNPKAADYQYYGGRNIKICEEWLQSYSRFREWAIATDYDENAKHSQCTIDRINVNGNYEPNNCRWVDMTTQSRSRRNVINKKER